MVLIYIFPMISIWLSLRRKRKAKPSRSEEILAFASLVLVVILLVFHSLSPAGLSL